MEKISARMAVLSSANSAVQKGRARGRSVTKTGNYTFHELRREGAAGDW